MPRLIFTLILLLLLLPGAAPASVAPTWHLSLQTYSFHERTHAVDLHDFTPGIGLMRREGNWLGGGGAFRNSIGRWAGYGFIGWQAPLGPFRLGGIGGITHNYHGHDGGIVPLAAATATVPLTESLALDLVGIPRLRNYSYTTLHIALTWRFR